MTGQYLGLIDVQVLQESLMSDTFVIYDRNASGFTCDRPLELLILKI